MDLRLYIRGDDSRYLTLPLTLTQTREIFNFLGVAAEDRVDDAWARASYLETLKPIVTSGDNE